MAIRRMERLVTIPPGTEVRSTVMWGLSRESCYI
jgi:hypothetical protein